MSKLYKFIDLFAGLGGFHLALKKLGDKEREFECVFASELDPDLQKLYKHNHGIECSGDIRDYLGENPKPGLPEEFDILCAGFPCQPFSKSGEQEGMDCERDGDLFALTVDILREKTPEYFILENVPNLENHNGGETWKEMQGMLRNVDYAFGSSRFSPHEFDVPQIRDRFFILGIHRPNADEEERDRLKEKIETSLKGLTEERGRFGKYHEKFKEKFKGLLEPTHKDSKEFIKVNRKAIACLELWDEFIKKVCPKGGRWEVIENEIYVEREGKELPSFPIWATEFGATYPIDNPEGIFEKEWAEVKKEEMKGIFGCSLGEYKTYDEAMAAGALPSHATSFPPWKQKFIRQNRAFYSEIKHNYKKKNKKWFSKWLEKLQWEDEEKTTRRAQSYQKLEWNCQGEERNIWEFIIQLRPSGIRLKRPLTAPTLVAMTTTQVPIVCWNPETEDWDDRPWKEKCIRYMTTQECKKLQSMDDLEGLDELTKSQAFKALGNSVNVTVIKKIAEALLKIDTTKVSASKETKASTEKVEEVAV